MSQQDAIFISRSMLGTQKRLPDPAGLTDRADERILLWKSRGGRTAGVRGRGRGALNSMYWYEKDYIMRMIHGIAQILAYLWFGRKETELPLVMNRECGEENDYLRRMVDQGQINAAENRLFELLETAGWGSEQKAALILSFYDYVNGKDDAFLSKAGFSRDEIYDGMKDALESIGKEIPEYLRL